MPKMRRLHIFISALVLFSPSQASSQPRSGEISRHDYDIQQTPSYQKSRVSNNSELFVPVSIAFGNKSSTCGGPYRQFRLDASTPFATLDYGFEVAGYPFFEIESITRRLQIEVKYSEDAAGLDQDFSDGPFPFNIALANTYRVETFDIKEPGRIDAFLLQGGQRWQSIRLITDGAVTFKSVGFIPSIPVVDTDNLPGSFKCEDEVLNEIWKLGARAASVSCLESGTQKTIWEIDEENGAYIRGMRPGVTTKGAFFSNYTLEFEAKIDKGGIGWVLAFPLASPMQGIQLDLVADQQTFANFNKSLLRPNSILFGYGYSFVNVTTLPSYHLDTFNVPFAVKDGIWYKIKSVLDGETLSVSVDQVEIFKIVLKDYYIGDTQPSGAGIPSQGSFGFGGWQDQAGHVRNVVAYDTSNLTEIYRNTLTDAEGSVAKEYGVQANYEAACLDGPKRDRLVWLGDLLHTVRIVAASTSRSDLIRATLQLLLDWQTPSGLLPYAPPLGYDPSTASEAFATGGAAYFMRNEVYGILLVDYQILGVLSFTEYVRLSNDLEFANKTWAQWKASLEYLSLGINQTTGLLSVSSAFLGPSKGGSAINCALAQAFSEIADVADALGRTTDASDFHQKATDLASAINKNLWNEELGIYGISPADLNSISVPSMAFCITSGTATSQQAERFISALDTLKVGPGYMDSSTTNSSDPGLKISPNTNGFLLQALLAQDTSAAANTSLELIKSLWTPMISDKKTNTGASWEYVDKQGGPGLGLYTSLSHPWGGAPTYLLTQWAVGIQTAAGARGFGYQEWVIAPQMGVNMGLKKVSGTVMTIHGSLKVEWRLEDGDMHIVVEAPVQTKGVFKIGRTEEKLSGASRYQFSIHL